MPWDRSLGRDPRLDFFRGICMFIIFMAHVRYNIMWWYIPARLGPSDATEIFVFSSGFAAAIAFGGTFTRLGFWTGVRRVLYRCWQIYWAHMCLFFIVAFVCIVATWQLERNYIAQLNLTNFFAHTEVGLVGLLTFTYVPNLLDILPMYFVALLLMPFILLLRQVHLILAVLFSVSLWLAAWYGGLSLSADPWGDRQWYFNPFAWQFLFFTGFAISAGWIKGPPPKTWLVVLASVYVIAWIPLSYPSIVWNVGWLRDTRDAILAPGWKTNLHIVRYLHILCLAYLATCLLWNREKSLLSPWIAPIVKVGTQALPTFLTGIVLSWCGSIFLDQVGRTGWSFFVVNAGGCALLILVAYTVAWYKASPWVQRRPSAPAPPAPAPTSPGMAPDRVVAPAG